MANDGSLVFDTVLERDGVRVSRSPWGEDDEIGRLNWITPESRQRILERLDGTKMFDLCVDYFVGMPSFSAFGDPQYDHWLTHTPQGSVLDNATGFGPDVHRKQAYSSDSISMFTHTGTHLDTLNHYGYYGCFWNGWTPEQHLGSRSWTKGGANRYPPIVARSVLLDVAGLHGVDCLPDSYAIGPDDLRSAAREHRVELRRGDIVVVRTGRMTKWPDYDGYLRNPPGVDLAAARFLCEEAGAMCIGSDSVALEVMPSPDPEWIVPVHSYMCATAGAQIIEVLQLEELAAERVYEFAFVGQALKLTGATGAPLCATAVPLRE